MSPGITDALEEGWQRFAAAYQIGDVLDGTDVLVVPFGTFVEVRDAVHGLLLGAEAPARKISGHRHTVLIR